MRDFESGVARSEGGRGGGGKRASSGTLRGGRHTLRGGGGVAERERFEGLCRRFLSIMWRYM